MSNLGQHDGDGIRYAMHLSAPKGGSAQMLRDPAGGWVSWEDYARLKAEVERLTKAGDALAGEAIRLEYSNYWSEYEKVEDVCIDEVEAWHKAKGVQS